MIRICAATSSVITRLTTSLCPSLITSPEGATTCLTINGFNNSPPLAIAQIAFNICNGDTAIPCPIAIVATSDFTISSGL